MLTKHTVLVNLQGRKGTPLEVTIACGRLPRDIEPVGNPECHMASEWNKNAHRISFLKSHLQKTIRKGNPGLAVRTCKELLQRDVLQVVRRLSIIMVEDVDLHPSFNILLWWMIILSKQVSDKKKQGLGDVLQAGDVPSCLLEWLLGLTHMLCVQPHRSIFDTHDEQLPTIWQSVQILHPLHSIETRPTTQEHTECASDVKNTLCSVMLRASYGGLKDDMVLLRAVMHDYLLQYTSKPTTFFTFWKTTIQPIVYSTVNPLEIHTWDLDAIDFHISRHIVPKLEEWVNDPQVNVKRMMWENGSSVNVRDGTKKKYASGVWKSVLPRLRNWQSYVLQQ